MVVHICFASFDCTALAMDDDGEAPGDEGSPQRVDDTFVMPASAKVIVFPDDDPVFPAEVAYCSGNDLLYWDLLYTWDQMEAFGVSGTAHRMCYEGVQNTARSLDVGHVYLRGSNVR